MSRPSTISIPSIAITATNEMTAVRNDEICLIDAGRWLYIAAFLEKGQTPIIFPCNPYGLLGLGPSPVLLSNVATGLLPTRDGALEDRLIEAHLG